MQRTGLLELNAVVAVATHRSFRSAAAELGLSPSALSHAIAALERRMGVRLFNRTTRSVALSEAGEQFLGRVRPALREISDAMDAAHSLARSLTGTLRINTSEGAARLFLMPLVVEFLRRHPGMHVDLVTQDRLVDIVGEGFDAGIRLAESVPKDMIAVPCAPDVSFAVVGSPRYFKTRKPPLRPSDLHEHNCIRRRWPGGAIYRWEFARQREQLTLDVPGSLTLDKDALILHAARKGVGLAYLDEWTVARALAAGKLIQVLAEWTPRYPGPCLYYPSHRQIPAGLRAFIALLQEQRAVGTTAQSE